MDDDTKSADIEVAAFTEERAHPQPTAPALKQLSKFRHVTELQDAAPVLTLSDERHLHSSGSLQMFGPAAHYIHQLKVLCAQMAPCAGRRVGDMTYEVS